jgi:autotransporter-associated beta strand protein
MRKNRKHIVVAAAAVAGLAQVGYAANATWGANPADSFWNTPNWDNAGPYTPVAGDSLFFGASTVTNLNNNFAPATTFSGLTFLPGAASFTLGGNSIALTGPITVNAGGNTQTINFAVTGAPAILLGADGGTGNSLALSNDLAAGSLVVSSTGNTTANTLTIGTGRTLSVGGLFSVGIQNTADTLTRSELTVSGNGTLSVVNAGSFSLLVGLGKTANGAGGTGGFGTLNLGGLSNFVYSTTTGTIGFGVGTRGSAIVSLASTFNSLTAPSMSVGTTGGGNANGNSTINLGAGSNIFNVDSILIGGGKANALVQFAGGTGSLLIRGAAGGASTANITLGQASSATNSGTPSALLLDGHEVNVQGGTVIVGRLAGSAGGTASAGTINFDTGTFNANSLQLAAHASGTNPIVAGTFTLGGASPNDTATGVLNVSTQFLLVNRTLGTSTGAANSAFVINGGTANINADMAIVDAATGGSRNTNLTLAAGTLNMMGHAIASAALPINNVNLPQGGQTARLYNLGGTGINGVGLSKSGDGTLILGGANTYTGQTLINNGTLILAAGSTLPNTSLIAPQSGAALDATQVASGLTLAAGQTLGGGGTVYGNVNVGAATISPGSSAGTLTLNNNLNLTGGGTIALELSNSAGGGNDVININGALNLTGTTRLKLNALSGGFDTNPYTVMTYASRSGAGTLLAPGTGLITRQTFTLNVGATATTLTISGTPAANLVWAGNGTTQTWDHTATLWNGGAEKFFDLDNVTFNDSGTESPDINLVGALVPASVTVDSGGKHYIFAGAGSLTTDVFTKNNGGGTLTIANTGANNFSSFTVNSGTVIFTSSNTTTGATLINGDGRLQVGAGTTSGALPAGPITNNGSVIFNRSDTVILTANLTGTGGTEVRSGTLQIGNGSGGGALSTGSITNNANLVINRGADNVTIASGLSGNGPIIKQGSGIVTLGAPGDSSGGITIAAGAVRIANASGAGNGSVIIGGNTLIVGGVTINNALTIGGGTIGATGTVALNGDLTASGTSTIILADPTNLPVAPADVSELAINGNLHGNGTINVLSNGQDNNPDGGAGFRIRGDDVTDFTGVVRIGNNVKGELQTTQNGPFSPLNTGKLIVAAGDATLAGTLTTLTTTGGYSETNLRNNSGGDTVFGNDVEVSGTGLAILNPLGTAPVGAVTTMGNLKIGGGQELGIHLNAAPIHAVAFTSVTLNGGNATLSPKILNYGTAGVVGADLNLNNISELVPGSGITMAGQRFLTITGSNTYTGTTTLARGTTRMNGSYTGGGAWTVQSGATLGGTGTIGAQVNVQSGGILAPGNSVGSLSVASLSLNTASLTFEIDGSGADRINVTATNGLTLSGVSTFGLTDLGGIALGTYPLIDYTGTALANINNFSLATTTLGGFTLALVNNTAGTSVDLLVATPGASASWNVDNNGNWTDGGNWTGGNAPNGADVTATFGTIITAPRVVTVNAPQTVGALNFDSPISYSIGGSSALTMDTGGGQANINVTAGAHTISAPVVLNKSTSINTAAGTGVALTGNLTATGQNITKVGSGTVQFENVRAAFIEVNGGQARIRAKATPNDTAGTSVVQSLGIGVSGVLDLTNNSMVIDYTGPVGTLVDSTRQHLQSGRMTSSSATTARGLGYANNAALDAVKTTFAGQTVDPSSILIKYTYFGDTDLDGDVDVADLGKLATAWQTSNVWSNGDFDYNGTVNVNDLGLLATNWQAGVGNPLAPSLSDALASLGLPNVSVPEPATMTLLGALGAWSMKRPRARRGQLC